MSTPENDQDQSAGAADAPRGHDGARDAVADTIIPAIVTILVILVLRMTVASPFIVPSGSMIPTLHPHSLIFGNTLAEPERGDVVVFSDPRWGEDYFVKRVIAVGGDTVGGCDARGDLLVNGSPMREDYIRDTPECRFPEVTVPDGRVWVMGDNRANSADSRYHTFTPGGADLDAGTVPVDAIKAVVWGEAHIGNTGGIPFPAASRVR